MNASLEEPDLYHLIYSSVAKVPLSPQKFLDLLSISRLKNEARGLTGMLLYRNGLYLQFLEGPRGHVENLLTTLSADPRHTSIKVLREGTLRGRLFPGWSMAFKNMAGLKASTVWGYSECLQANYQPSSDEVPEQLLVEMLEDLVSSR